MSVRLFRLLLTSRRTLGHALRLIRDSRVGLRLKVLVVLGAVFILSPLNILGDIPVIGIVDDAALLALLLSWFVRAAEPAPHYARSVATPVRPQ